MGLGLKLHVPREDLNGRTWGELSEAIVVFALHTGDPLLDRVVRIDADEGVLYVALHPAEAPVVFYPDSTGALEVQGGSAVAGPGFHAYLVRWLEALGRALGLAWIGEGPDAGDATGYLDHQSFDALQAEHAVWLRGLAQVLVTQLATRPGDPAALYPWALGLEATGPIPARVPRRLASCLGYLDEAYFDALAAADEDASQALAARFFPWWDEGVGAGFWDGVARSLAWTRVAWRPARTEADRALYHLVLDAFDRAQAIDPNRVPPEAEVAELHWLLSDAAEDRPPAPTGIGFRRHEVTLPLPGGWRVRLPGYFHEDDATPAGTTRFWFGEREVTLTAAANGAGGPGAEAALRALDPPADAEWHRTGDTVGFASMVRGTGGPGAARWVLRAGIAAEGDREAARVRLTVAFADEADGDWAREVWRSVRFEGGA